MKELPINRIICGDALTKMKPWPANSIDMCMTSPPYWSLRDYGVEQIFGGDKDCEHKWNTQKGNRNIGRDDKFYGGIVGASHWAENPKKPVNTNFCLKCHAWKGQLGLEPTPEFYIEHLTKIFNEVKRVLKKSGTLWIVIGDTYWGGKGRSAHGDPERHIKRLLEGKTINKPYQEIGAPGEIKPGDGKHAFIQPKSLCMIPERLAWSLIQNGWILRNKNIWFKPNAMPSSVRDRFSNRWEYIFMFSKNKKYYFDLDAVREKFLSEDTQPRSTRKTGVGQVLRNDIGREFFGNPLGKNPGDVFEINTQPFPEAHFAVFPEKLCEKPIKAGCPENGILLDPFCGAGTALYVAKEMRRRHIGIDIKKEYCNMTEERLAQEVL